MMDALTGAVRCFQLVLLLLSVIDDGTNIIVR